MAGSGHPESHRVFLGPCFPFSQGWNLGPPASSRSCFSTHPAPAAPKKGYKSDPITLHLTGPIGKEWANSPQTGAPEAITWVSWWEGEKESLA